MWAYLSLCSESRDWSTHMSCTVSPTSTCKQPLRNLLRCFGVTKHGSFKNYLYVRWKMNSSNMGRICTVKSKRYKWC